MADRVEIRVELEISARRSWSYVLSGTKRALVAEIRLINNGSDSTSGIPLTPRVRIARSTSDFDF